MEEAVEPPKYTGGLLLDARLQWEPEGREREPGLEEGGVVLEEQRATALGEPPDGQRRRPIGEANLEHQLERPSRRRAPAIWAEALTADAVGELAGEVARRSGRK